MNSIFDKYIKIVKNDKESQIEINKLFKPLIDLILIEIYPYVYISMIFIIISFLLILGIFILLIRSNYTIKTNNL
jgi:hypothetical protein